MRTLNGAAQALLARARAGESIEFVQLLELQLDATQYLCTAGRDVTWGGHTWLGTGIQLEPINDTAAEWRGINLALPGVTEAQLAIALEAALEGKSVRIYDALIDPATGALADAILAWAGTLNAPSLEDGPKATVTIAAEHRAASAFRTKPLRYTNTDQQRLYPGDTCLDYDPQTDAGPIVWPAASFFRV